MKTLVTIWFSVIGTFGLTSAYILSNAKDINAPGELGEYFSAAGITLAALLLVMTAIALTIVVLKTKRQKQ
jgi:hypothetical protein